MIFILARPWTFPGTQRINSTSVCGVFQIFHPLFNQSGIFPKPFIDSFNLYTVRHKNLSPAVFFRAEQIVDGMIPGNGHKRNKPHFSYRICFQGFEHAFQAGTPLNSTNKNVFILCVQVILQGGIKGSGGMVGAMLSPLMVIMSMPSRLLNPNNSPIRSLGISMLRISSG